MLNPSTVTRRAEAQYQAFCAYILPLAPTFVQALKTLASLSATRSPERSLPCLTDTIEFLEQIKRQTPFIQPIASRLYSWAKGIKHQHVRQIATLMESSWFNQCEQHFVEELKISPKQQQGLSRIQAKVGLNG